MANHRLRTAMLQRGIHPEALAHDLEVDPKSVQRWLSGRQTPYRKHRHRIAAIVGEDELYLWPDAVSKEQVAAAARSELVDLYPHRADAPPDLWLWLLKTATTEVDFLVYAGLFLPEQTPALIPTLKAKAEQGVAIRLAFGDPDSAEVAERGEEERIGETAIGIKIRNVLVHYEPLFEVPGIQVRLHSTTLYNSIYRFDDQMLVNTHVYGFVAGLAPMLHLRRLSDGDLFSTYTQSFNRVWASSRAVDLTEPLQGAA
jgi:transcriptional regulator with XRE-family HTH domain